MTITIVGLGPGDPGLLTIRARDALMSGGPVWLRTARHPGISALAGVTVADTFDHLYETLDSFDAIYAAIIERLLAEGHDAEIVYAVPGDPLIGEATVRRLLERFRAGNEPSINVIHGISFLEPVCAAVGLDPLEDGAQLVDALDPRLDPTRPAIVAQIYNRRVAVSLKLALLDL